MPSVNKTSNLGLNQWQGNEYPKRIDFNEDNTLIDTKIGEIEQTIQNINVPVTSVNQKTGDVVLSASDIKNSENKTIETKLTEQSTQMAELETKKVDKTAINDSVTSTSSTTVASSKAVKTAYDKGNHAHPYAPDSHVGAGGTAHALVTTSASGFMSAADKSKLNGIEAGATGDQTASEILTLLKTVDGSGSSLDADLLDGKHASEFYSQSSKPYVIGTYSGDDTTRIINVGFTPSAVLLFGESGATYFDNNYVGGLAVTGNPVKTHADTQVEFLKIVTNGFEVKNVASLGVNPNSSNYRYNPFRYIAFR